MLCMVDSFCLTRLPVVKPLRKMVNSRLQDEIFLRLGDHQDLCHIPVTRTGVTHQQHEFLIFLFPGAHLNLKLPNPEPWIRFLK